MTQGVSYASKSTVLEFRTVCSIVTDTNMYRLVYMSFKEAFNRVFELSYLSS